MKLTKELKYVAQKAIEQEAIQILTKKSLYTLCSSRTDQDKNVPPFVLKYKEIAMLNTVKYTDAEIIKGKNESQNTISLKKTERRTDKKKKVTNVCAYV